MLPVLLGTYHALNCAGIIARGLAMYTHTVPLVHYAILVCDRILENLCIFGHIGWLNTFIYMSYEKEDFSVKFHSKKV